ncbi:MAG: hypothetical protein VX211_03850 [Pseudomonadota bacterium]|nr:hypothetical protein [Pseudomonadota bacterium]
MKHLWSLRLPALQLLVIVLAGLMVQAVFSDQIDNVKYPDVSLETVVITEASVSEFPNEDQSLFAWGKEVTRYALTSVGFDRFPEMKRQEERVKTQTALVHEELGHAVSNRTSQRRIVGEAEIASWTKRVNQVSADVFSATETVTHVASEILAVQLVALNGLLSLNAPVSGNEAEIRRWVGERSIGRMVE